MDVATGTYGKADRDLKGWTEQFRYSALIPII
jgi:hypothetical protein